MTLLPAANRLSVSVSTAANRYDTPQPTTPCRSFSTHAKPLQSDFPSLFVSAYTAALRHD
jgi:hypothetical protein